LSYLLVKPRKNHATGNAIVAVMTL